MKRVAIIAAALAAAGLTDAGGAPARAQGAAAAKEVTVALIAPLSGPWAREGQLMQMGADMAIDEINDKGGIAALGGAKMKLVVADAGDTTEKAKNAAQRLLAQEPDLVGGAGAWLSSFTLAVTEVTERAQIPWLTLSYSDAITGRGYKYVFQTSPTANRMAEEMIPTVLKLADSAGAKKLQNVGIIMDNTASNVSFVKPLHEGALDPYGLKLTVDQVFTPPLSDATPLVQKLRSNRPDMLLMLSSNVPDDSMLLQKLAEFGMPVGKLPTIGAGAHLGVPELRKVTDAELLEGLLFTTGNWSLNHEDELIARFKKRTGEPWLTQDSICAYGDMWIFKAALEKVGAADHIKVAEALHTMEITDGPAAEAFPGPVKFDANGRRSGAPVVIAQWQKGEAVSVYPTDRALAKAVWPTGN
ncbi:MAG: ABC transporter substrate-binding protein [Alphaproteobacteria bacterium]|nr:ABC transporter substrate-binding protein [Alphaproteobacteria bacterium]